MTLPKLLGTECLDGPVRPKAEVPQQLSASTGDEAEAALDCASDAEGPQTMVCMQPGCQDDIWARQSTAASDTDLVLADGMPTHAAQAKMPFHCTNLAQQLKQQPPQKQPAFVGARSISHQQQEIRKSFSKPRCLVLIAGGVLACCAGIVNTTAYLQLGGHFVSHMSGTAAHIGVRVEAVDNGLPVAQELRFACLILTSFVLGALLCGLVVARNEISFGKSMYGVALAGNSALLIAAAFVPWRELALYLSAAAMGLQNGMCTMHFGAVVRTTHITGIVTDLGTVMGRMLAILLRRRCSASRLGPLDLTELEVDLQRMGVFSLLLCSFTAGCVFGAFLQRSLHQYTLLVPAGITGVGGVAYMFFRQQLKKPLRNIGVIRMSAEVKQAHEILEKAADVLESVRRQAAAERSCSRQAHDAALTPRAPPSESMVRHARGEPSPVSASITPGGRSWRDDSDIAVDEGLEDSIGHMLIAIHDVEAGLMRLVHQEP